jgi:hypothetical protein
MYSFALRFLFLHSRNLLQFLYRRKEEKPIENDTPFPIKNLKSENSQDYDQKAQSTRTFMNSASGVNDVFNSIIESTAYW